MDEVSPILEEPRTRSYGELVWRDFRSNRLAMFGTLIIFLVVITAVFCPFLANQRPLYIRATFENDYWNALFITIEQIELLAAEEEADDTRRLIEENFAAMRSHLAPGDRAALEDIRLAYREAVSPLNPQALLEITSRIDALFEANLQPVSRYPVIRALRKGEIFVLFIFFFSVLVFLFRKRIPSIPLQLFLIAVLAFSGTMVWKHFYPTIQDSRPYRQIVEAEGFAESGTVVLPIVPYGENENLITEARQAPTWILKKEKAVENQHWHWLGTDTNGRDVLARMVYGARVSMLVGIVAVTIYTIIGIIVGAVAGYFGGWIDMLVSRIIEVVICFPPLILILVVQAFLAPSLLNIILALAALWWTAVARLQRGEFLRLVNMDYIQAIRALGGGNIRIIFLHLLPNGLGPILVLVSFGIAGSILIESGLSFLGFGVPQPMASWGDLLNNGRNDVQGLWWLTIFPGMAIFLTVTCFNLVGEGVRDSLDPMKER